MIKHGIKGLYSFIDEVRCCKTKEEEEKRVLRELVKIKKCFSEKNITNYKRKKNIWKLIYCHILGYGISVGYFDIIKLMSSPNLSDKYCGYTAISLLLNEKNDVLNILVSTVKEDVNSKDEQINALALNFICHKINDLIVENVYEDILQIATFNYIYKPYIRKKAFSCISNICKKRHDLLLKKKGDMDILMFLDQNLNEVNLSNVFSYLNLIYIVTLIFQKYEKLYNYKKEEERKERKSKKEGNYMNLLKREDFRSLDNNNGYINFSKRISLHIKDEITKKGKGHYFIKEGSFFYDDIKKIDKFLEIESDCYFNYEDVNYEELRRYVYKYIHYILQIIHYIINDTLRVYRDTCGVMRHSFLLIKCLQMLQLFDIEMLSVTVIKNINDILHKIVYEPYKKLQGRENGKNEISKNSNEDTKTIFKKNFGKNNNTNNTMTNNKIVKNDKSTIYIEYGIIYECANLLSFLQDKAEDRNRDIIVCLLLSSLDTNKSNINYVILNSLSKLKMNLKIYNMLESYIMHIINLLNNGDITIKLQLFNILFNICNNENWKLLINVLLHHLPNIDSFIQNEIIIKITILSEYFSPDLSWYIDIVFKIIEIMHKSILPEVWHRLIQIITGFVEIEDDQEHEEHQKKKPKEYKNKKGTQEVKKAQKYAALKCYKYMSKKITNIELLIELCSYLIGSFGYLIKEKVPIKNQYIILEKYFTFVSSNTKCIILMAMMKLLFYDNNLVNYIRRVLNSCINNCNLELQARACEFLNLLKLNNFSMIRYLLKNMPLYQKKKVHENFLIKRLIEINKHAIIDFNDGENYMNDDKNKCISFEKKQIKKKERSYSKHKCRNSNGSRSNSSSTERNGDGLINDFSSHSTESKNEKFIKKKTSLSSAQHSSHYTFKASGNSNKDSNAPSPLKSSKSLDPRNNETEKIFSTNSSSLSKLSESDETSKCEDSVWSNESSDSDEEPQESKGSKFSSGSSSNSKKSLLKLLCLQKANTLNDLWLNACLLNKSVFAKNDVISIFVKHKYQDNKGIIIMYIKNISNKAITLSSVHVEQCNNIHIKEQKAVVDEKIHVAGIYSYKLYIFISDVFYKIPDITFNIITSDAPRLNFTCKLPILITRFIKESKMNEQAFKNYWKILTQTYDEDIKMGIPKFSKKYFLNYLINAFNFYTLKIGMFICAAGYLSFPDGDKENKILIFVKIRYGVKGCHISVVTNVKYLNSYLNKIFEIYLIKNK